MASSDRDPPVKMSEVAFIVRGDDRLEMNGQHVPVGVIFFLL